MKAILVIDMPTSCKDCRLNYDDYWCKVAGYGILSHLFEKCPIRDDGFPEFCPLKPMPDKKEEGYPNDDYTIGKADGWNDCLKEIEK